MKKHRVTLCIVIFLFGFYLHAESVHKNGTNLLIPHITGDPGWETLLILENTSDNAQTIRLELFSKGVTTQVQNYLIDPGVQKTIQLQGADCGQVHLYSPRISAKLVFHHLQEGGLAEIPLTSNTSPTLHILLSGAFDPNLTWQGFALMNPGPDTSIVTVNAYSSEGNVIESTDLQINGYSRWTGILESLFPSSASEHISRIEIQANQALAGLCISGLDNKKLLFSNALVQPESGTLELPHFATQETQWENTLVFDNIGDTEQRVAVTLFKDTMEIGNHALTIPAGQTVLWRLDDPSYTGVERGTVSSINPQVFIRQRILHRATGNASEFLIDSLTNRAQTLNWPNSLSAQLDWKGVAVSNPGRKETTVQLEGIINGTVTLVDQIIIPAGGKWVATLDTIFEPTQVKSLTRLNLFASRPVTAIQIAGSKTGQLLFGHAQPMNRAPVFVTLFSHNEDSWEDLVSTESGYLKYREDLLNRLHAIDDFGGKLDWQSDWPVLEAMIKFENGEILESTQGKNILRFMTEEMGFSVDPHGHLIQYNYADLAFLISQLGVEPSGVIGGCRIVDCGESALPFELLDWEKDIDLQDDGMIEGDVFSGATWRPTILSGPAWGSHWFDDYTSGIWNPGSTEDFYRHDIGNDITYVGQGYPHDLTNVGEGRVAVFAKDGAYIKEMVQKIEDGELSSHDIHTASMHIRDIGYISDKNINVLQALNQVLGELEPYAARGDISYITYPEAKRIWEERYQSVACQVPINRFSFHRSIVDQAGSHCRKNPISTLFSINVHDWTQPEKSAATLNRILDIHERYNIFVDVYLTDSVARIYNENYPELIARLRESPVVAMSYHIRPSSPYYWDFDFLGLQDMPSNDLDSLLLKYEQNGVDLASGLPNESGTGGVDLIEELFGLPPYAVGGFSHLSQAGESLQAIFNQKGIPFYILHNQEALELGDTAGTQYVRPEHIEIKIYEYENSTGKAVIDQQLLGFEHRGELFMNLKVHENNFYTVQTPWWPVFYENAQKSIRLDPPFNLEAWKDQLVLRSEESANQRWRVYEEAVSYVASNRFSFNSIHCGHLTDRLEEISP